jgi:hypothetical protein
MRRRAAVASSIVGVAFAVAGVTRAAPPNDAPLPALPPPPPAPSAAPSTSSSAAPATRPPAVPTAGAPVAPPPAPSASSPSGEDLRPTWRLDTDVERPEAPPQPPPPPPAPIAAESARWAAVWNVTAVFIRRYSFDGLYLVAPKHAVLVNLHYDYASQSYPSLDYGRSDAYSGGGGEIGYRQYPHGHGLSGAFFGPSVVLGWYRVPYYGQYLTLRNSGLAFDVGGQALLGDHFTIIAGGGGQYVWTSRYPKDIAPGIETNVGQGFQLRIFLSMGAVF